MSQDDTSVISKTEDMRIRAWIKASKEVRVEQYGLWKLTLAEAQTFLKKNYGLDVSIVDLSRAARRTRATRTN